MKLNLILGFTCLIVLFSNTLQAQDSVYYYDNSYRAANPEAAIIISIARKEDSGWLRMDYYSNNKKVHQVGHFKDHTFEIKEGEFKTFFANEQLNSIGTYKNNEKNSFFEIYYPNGMMSDSCSYKNGIPTGICYAWYPDGAVKSILQMDTLGNGSGIAAGYFPNGNISYKGKIARGMRKIGAWTYYHENGNKASILKFPTLDETTLSQAPELKYDTLEGCRYDSLVEYSSAICFDENGVEQAGSEIKNNLPSYKNGIPGWISYVSNKMKGLGDTYLAQNGGKTIVYESYFTIDPNGKVNNVLLTNKIDPVLDDRIKNILSNSNIWKPAMHNNRKIPFTHKQAFVMTRSDIYDAAPPKITTTIEKKVGRGNNPLHKNID